MLGIVEVNYFPPSKKSNSQSASECCVDGLLNESDTGEHGTESGHDAAAASTHTGSQHIDISTPIPVTIPVPVSLLGVGATSAVTSDDANVKTSLSVNLNSTEEETDNAEQIPCNSEESVAPPEPMFR